LDVKGSAERAMYLQQGGFGKAREAFMNMLDRLPAGTESSKSSMLQQRLQALDSKLVETKNLPELAKATKAQYHHS
jgi:hypothetical protein